MHENYSPTIDAIRVSTPPPLLFHYTGPSGLIGILQSKALWATNVGYLNDTKELRHAIDYIKNAIENRLRTNSDADQVRALLKRMLEIEGAAPQVYVASLTEERDLLSQWRAYCPPGGGYAVGFPAQQLRAMAIAQAFLLVPCVYDHQRQYSVAMEIIQVHVNRFCAALDAGYASEEAIQQILEEFIEDTVRYGPILKHRSFGEEKEWRLISPVIQLGHPKIRYRPGSNSIIPYVEFNLIDKAHPSLIEVGVPPESLTVIVGPTADTPAGNYALQSILHSCIGMGCWMGSSETPYRGR